MSEMIDIREYEGPLVISWKAPSGRWIATDEYAYGITGSACYGEYVWEMLRSNRVMLIEAGDYDLHWRTLEFRAGEWVCAYCRGHKLETPDGTPLGIIEEQA